MFRAPSISVVLALLALVLCCETRAATDPSPWLEIHSTHFTVITDAGVTIVFHSAVCAIAQDRPSHRSTRMPHEAASTGFSAVALSRSS